MGRIRSEFRAIGIRVLGTCALVLVPASLPAQSMVAGRVALQEKPGEKTTDYGNTVVWLEPSSGTARATPIRTQVGMSERTFTPHVRVVPVGSTVEYPNQDPFTHNVFSTTPGALFDLGAYASGTSKGYQFRKTGAYPTYCNIHAKMAAYVVVVNTPWYAQAAADGRWQVTNVPVGKYRLTVWHERAPKVTTELEVPAGGVSGIETTLDARGYRVVAHKNKFGRDYTNAGVVY